MPKITSLSSKGSNKENIVPLSRFGKATKATSSREDEDEEEEEEVTGHRDEKRSKSINTVTKQSKQPSKTAKEVVETATRPHKSSSSDSAPMKRQRESEEDPLTGEQERKSRRERLLEEKLALITKERDEVQSQFDEMREMRQTEPERLLAEWKKLANRRDAQAEEYITKLKSQLKVAGSKGEGVMSSSSDGAFIHRINKDDEEESSRKEKKLKEEVTKLKQELATASLALNGRTVQGSASVGMGDEKAIRRLYEDLTGLVINKVEPAVNREKDYYRCFHAIFASDGFYNLEMKLEESESNLPSNDHHATREDIVYVPAMNPDRDAEIIASGKLPAYLAESLRFERSTAVRFMNTLHKRLDKSSRK